MKSTIIRWSFAPTNCQTGGQQCASPLAQQVVDVFVDVFFITDIVINFRTAYYRIDGELELDADGRSERGGTRRGRRRRDVPRVDDGAETRQ